MTRSHKHPPGDRISHGIEKEPLKAKKDGGGKGNWGRDGDEIEDVIEEEHITTSKSRRRSNSISHLNGTAVKSKFEVNDVDEEAVQEE